MLGLGLRSSRVLAIAILAAAQIGCGPYVLRYMHPCFDEGGGLEILERSTTSTDSQGRELMFAEVGLPIKARVARPSYIVLIDTPINAGPVVFLRATTREGNRLNIEGPHVHPVHPSVADLSEREYSFYVDDAKGEPLQLVVRDDAGTQVGTERLPYELRSRGMSFGIESL